MAALTARIIPVILTRRFKPVLYHRAMWLSDAARPSKEASFEELFENSQFAKLGRPVNKVVIGEVTHIVNNELYIDIGWKFHGVVKVDAGKIKRQVYKVGDKLDVKINDLEITGHFLGQHKRITLCEADLSLVEDE